MTLETGCQKLSLGVRSTRGSRVPCNRQTLPHSPRNEGGNSRVEEADGHVARPYWPRDEEGLGRCPARAPIAWSDLPDSQLGLASRQKGGRSAGLSDEKRPVTTVAGQCPDRRRRQRFTAARV